MFMKCSDLQWLKMHLDCVYCSIGSLTADKKENENYSQIISRGA